MKIIAPISELNEAEMLLHFGADELYCGVCTPEWQSHFGSRLWMNRRDPFQANILSWQDIQKLADLAHANNARVHLTLNAPFYPKGSTGYLLKLSNKLVSEIGADGLIVSDLNMLILLAEEKLPVRIPLSSLGSCFNAEAVDFYLSLGVKRIILPRQLKLSEIKRLIGKAASDMEFEVFALNDGCFFEEGFCQTSHTLGPFCLSDWQMSTRTLECLSPSVHTPVMERFSEGNGISDKEILTPTTFRCLLQNFIATFPRCAILFITNKRLF